jgi:hypothetical protein
MPDDEQTPLLGSSKPSKITPKQPPKFADNDTDDNLTKFRKAVGININVDDTGADLESARKGARGLYKEVIDQQTRRSRQYILVEILFYLALGAQIVIGATLTALGPISGLHSKAITILGVINTSTAGVLALFKGQGLPDRLRKQQVFGKYNAARDTAEMNRPDSYGHQPEAPVQRSKNKGSFGVGRNIIAGDGNGKARAIPPAPQDSS